MGRPRSRTTSTASLDAAEVDARLHRANRRLLEYRAHEIHPRGAQATAAIEAHRAAHADEFRVRAKHGQADLAKRQALVEAAEAAVPAMEVEQGPPPGAGPFAEAAAI